MCMPLTKQKMEPFQMFGASIRSLRLGRRRRKGGKLKELNPALHYKEFEATLFDMGTVKTQPALVLWADTASDTLSSIIVIDRVNAWGGQSIYLRPNDHRLPECFTGHTVCVSNNFIPVGSMPCHLGKSPGGGVGWGGVKIVPHWHCHLHNPTELNWHLWPVCTSFIHSVLKNERLGGRRSQKEHQKPITQHRQLLC